MHLRPAVRQQGSIHIPGRIPRGRNQIHDTDVRNTFFPTELFSQGIQARGLVWNRQLPQCLDWQRLSCSLELHQVPDSSGEKSSVISPSRARNPLLHGGCVLQEFGLKHTEEISKGRALGLKVSFIIYLLG